MTHHHVHGETLLTTEQVMDKEHEHALSLDALLAVEWAGGTDDGSLYDPCPYCQGEKPESLPRSLGPVGGHSATCKLAEALRVAGFPVRYKK
jgi:hypothetical protein